MPAAATGYSRTTQVTEQLSRLSTAASNCGHILLKYRYQENKRFILLDANTTARDLKTSQLLSLISRNAAINATANRRSVPGRSRRGRVTKRGGMDLMGIAE
jgi:hypothetical protein